MKIRAQNNRSIWTCFFFFAGRQTGNLQSVLGGGGPEGEPSPEPSASGSVCSSQGQLKGSADVGVWFKISLSQAEMWWMKL